MVTRKQAGIAGKLLLVIAPAFVTSYYSYRTAKVEAEVKVQASKAQAEAGYQTLVEAVTKHEERLRALETTRTSVNFLRPLPVITKVEPLPFPRNLESARQRMVDRVQYGAGAQQFPAKAK